MAMDDRQPSLEPRPRPRPWIEQYLARQRFEPGTGPRSVALVSRAGGWLLDGLLEINARSGISCRRSLGQCAVRAPSNRALASALGKVRRCLLEQGLDHVPTGSADRSSLLPID